MGDFWNWVNRNSSGLIVFLMLVSAIVGPSVFIWTEVQVNSAEIRQLQKDVSQVREDIRILREDMREGFDGLEERLGARIEQNQRQLLEILAGHMHDSDGSVLFRTPPVSSP